MVDSLIRHLKESADYEQRITEAARCDCDQQNCAFHDEDPRKVGVKKGIRQLKSWQIMRVLQYDKPMAWDDGNYVDGKFCQLAVGIGLHEVDTWSGDGEPTDSTVKLCIQLEGMNPVNTKGIKGEFFTTHRERDFNIAAREVLAERGIFVPERIPQ